MKKFRATFIILFLPIDDPSLSVRSINQTTHSHHLKLHLTLSKSLQLKYFALKIEFSDHLALINFPCCKLYLKKS